MFSKLLALNPRSPLKNTEQLRIMYIYRFKSDVELSQDTDYKIVAVEDDGTGDTVLAIKIRIDTAADYTCRATYYDGKCAEQQFISDTVSITVIEAVPLDEPVSMLVPAGTEHTISCKFPNAYPTRNHQIKWSSNGKVGVLWYYPILYL